LALSNAERQRAWRERQKGKPRGNQALMAELAALRARVAELEAEARGNVPRQGKPTAGGRAASAGRLWTEHVALKQCDALRLLLNQIRSYAPKIPSEARAWAEKQWAALRITGWRQQPATLRAPPVRRSSSRYHAMTHSLVPAIGG
jgi:hypothetical protein